MPPPPAEPLKAPKDMNSLEQGHIHENIAHFQAAVDKQTWKNPNPYSGEYYFNFCLALEADGQDEKAFDS